MGDQTDADFGPSGLASLSISGFRGIDQLDIPRLGRVVLLAGKNGVGKTTVLEALRLHAARGRSDVLRAMLSLREELTLLHDDDVSYAPAVDRLFHYDGNDYRTIVIGPSGGGEPTLRIDNLEDLSDVPDDLMSRLSRVDTSILRVVFGHTKNFYPWPGVFAMQDGVWGSVTRTSSQDETRVRSESMGPGSPSSGALARLWDKVALTDGEALAVDALRLVFGNRVERVAVVGEDVRAERSYGSSRRVVVKLADQARPVPLRSLGDGATRMFGVSLALSNCRHGILLIDEAENGIHYTLQSKFWDMVLCAAETHNTQVVATTHSKDCINGFAAAALASPNIDCNLVRIGRRNGELRAVEYSTEELQTAAEQNIEVR